MTIEIPTDARPAGPDAAAEVVEAFTAATVTTFSELTSTAVSLREPVLLSMSGVVGEINAVIDLRRRLPGRLICTFSRAVMETLAQRYLPDGARLTPDILDDVAGEFANVIAGQAKTMLKGTPYHYAISTPVVSRRPIEPARLADERAFHLFLFDADVGGFSVQVELPSCA